MKRSERNEAEAEAQAAATAPAAPEAPKAPETPEKAPETPEKAPETPEKAPEAKEPAGKETVRVMLLYGTWLEAGVKTPADTIVTVDLDFAEHLVDNGKARWCGPRE